MRLLVYIRHDADAGSINNCSFPDLARLEVDLKLQGLITYRRQDQAAAGADQAGGSGREIECGSHAKHTR